MLTSSFDLDFGPRCRHATHFRYVSFASRFRGSRDFCGFLGTLCNHVYA
jgi:hypothetical protein